MADGDAERCEKSPTGFHDDDWYLFDQPCGHCGTTDLNVWIDGVQQSADKPTPFPDIVAEVDRRKAQT